jgi:hypothetical protein
METKVTRFDSSEEMMAHYLEYYRKMQVIELVSRIQRSDSKMSNLKTERAAMITALSEKRSDIERKLEFYNTTLKNLDALTAEYQLTTLAGNPVVRATSSTAEATSSKQSYRK